MFLARIKARRHNKKAHEMEFQAALKGKKIKIPRVSVHSSSVERKKDQPLTEKQEGLMAQKMSEALKRKLKEKKGEDQ